MVTGFDPNNFDAIQISLASADKVRSWSHGEVKKPETINYRTLKPEKDGLFCEKIFGPTKDWECGCGKYKRIRFKGIVCERCGVEVTRARVRRERMGHIELAAPVSHIWYFKGTPSRMGYLLDITPKDLEKVLYYGSYIITSVDTELREADAAELREELSADLEEIDAELERMIESLRAQAERAAADEFSDEEPMTEEELQMEIIDLREEYAERKDLRAEAFEAFMKISERDLITDEELYREMRTCYFDYFKGGIGAEAIRTLLESIDLKKTAEELEEVIATSKSHKREKAVKRLRVVAAFLKSESNPADMVLDVIPVIPPDLRPMVQLDGGRFATSDLNDLYRRVINRNNRLKRLLELGAPEVIINSEKRILQEAVDMLFDNGRRGRPVTGPGGRALRSLSDMLKGKHGRFRQNLLGKRVDYSGRSVIVVEPNLKLHQCGVPKTMALELFKPFVMRRLVELEHSINIKGAKRAIERQATFVWDVLEEVIQDHPVLLNRAPTLHRLSIQAFEPVLVEGKALKLHPLVCTAFNADFDGDQMAIHVPLSTEACAEARVLMLSANNLRSPANGKPLAVPTQDMIVGMYYLTSPRAGFEGEGRVFMSFEDAINAYDARADVDLQANIQVRLLKDTVVKSSYTESELMPAGSRLSTTIGRIIFNSVLPEDHPFINYVMNKKEVGRLVQDCCDRYTTSEMQPILDGIKSTGYHYATRAGLTVSVWDATIPPEKADILADADKAVDEIDEIYEAGMMTHDERHRKVIEIWNAANDEVGDAMASHFDSQNPIFMMADSGARGDIKQIRQLAGMRGLMSDPKGEIIDLPIKSNFREGLSVLEYFVSTHGARKGLADTALKTADAGYLTRRLVDVAQDVIVHEGDCGTDEGVCYSILSPKGELDDNLIGRCLLEPAVNEKTGEILIEAGDYISSHADLERLIDAGITEVTIRTVMTCHCAEGVCQKCYGWDLASRRPVTVGTAVGIIAAQSIGEPGTQLTMRTFHSGGIAGDDITHGLPRVEELFEARRPKGQAVLAEIDGTLQITATETGRLLTITDNQGNLREYEVSARAQFLPNVVDGAEVKIGQQLTKGSINPHSLLELTDPNTALRYIVEGVQSVYTSQGVDINDKHVEVIARQMLRRIIITDPGDSRFLPGQQCDRVEFRAESQRVGAQGGELPAGRPVLLGITKAALATASWLSAASFQETTKVLTDAALEGKIDDLCGLKENVIVAGKKIPAGTGFNVYRNVGLTYKGERVDANVSRMSKLPDFAPDSLKHVESTLPVPAEYFDGGDFEGSSARSHNGHTIPSDVAKLYLFDDLQVSQRWTNKFSEVGIETVGDLIGKTEEDLLRIDGIGAKAIEELRDGLEKYDLLYLLEPEEETVDDDELAKLLDMVFSPDTDEPVMIGGSIGPRVYTSDDLIGAPSTGAVDPGVINEDFSSLDELLAQVEQSQEEQEDA